MTALWGLRPSLQYGNALLTYTKSVLVILNYGKIRINKYARMVCHNIENHRLVVETRKNREASALEQKRYK